MAEGNGASEGVDLGTLQSQDLEDINELVWAMSRSLMISGYNKNAPFHWP